MDPEDSSSEERSSSVSVVFPTFRFGLACLFGVGFLGVSASDDSTLGLLFLLPLPKSSAADSRFDVSSHFNNAFLAAE